jgi:hypothetical protein
MEARTFTYLSGDALLDDGTHARARLPALCGIAASVAAAAPLGPAVVSSSATSRVPTPP